MERFDSSLVVAIVAPDAEQRANFAQLVERAGFAAAACETAAQLIELEHQWERIGCIVMDSHLPEHGALQVQRRLTNWPVPPPVIVLARDSSMEDAVEAMRAGAIDVLRKPPAERRLLDDIHEALERRRSALASHHLRRQLLARRERLSTRERDVMQLVTQGLPNKAVAARLNVTSKAVEAYRARLMKKMEARSFAELVLMSVVLDGSAFTADALAVDVRASMDGHAVEPDADHADATSRVTE